MPHPNPIVSTIVLFLIVFAGHHIRGVHQKKGMTARLSNIPFQLFFILLGNDRVPRTNIFQSPYLRFVYTFQLKSLNDNLTQVSGTTARAATKHIFRKFIQFKLPLTLLLLFSGKGR